MNNKLLTAYLIISIVLLSVIYTILGYTIGQKNIQNTEETKSISVMDVNR